MVRGKAAKAVLAADEAAAEAALPYQGSPAMAALGRFASLGDQTLGVIVAVLYSGILTTVIALAIKYTMGLRLDEEDEVNGIDLAAHGETAYDLHSGTSGGGSVLAASTAPVTADVGTPALVPDATFLDLPKPDVVVVPGGPDREDIATNPALRAWLLGAAPSVDAVMIAGDLLDIRSPVGLDVQATAVTAALRRLAGETVLFAASGNHDLDGRDAAGEKAARWMASSPSGSMNSTVPASER